MAAVTSLLLTKPNQSGGKNNKYNNNEGQCQYKRNFRFWKEKINDRGRGTIYMDNDLNITSKQCVMAIYWS